MSKDPALDWFPHLSAAQFAVATLFVLITPFFLGRWYGMLTAGIGVVLLIINIVQAKRRARLAYQKGLHLP